MDYDRSFTKISEKLFRFLEKIGIKASCLYLFQLKDNITERSENMPWYDGDTVLEVWLFETAGLP